MDKKNNMIRQTFTALERIEPSEKVTNKGTVSWGDKNLYAQWLVSLKNNNPVHGGIINQKVKFITSGGITVEGADATVLNNSDEYTLQEVVESLILDYEISDEYCALFKRANIGSPWYVEHVDFELIRSTEDGVYYEYSEDWSKSSQTEKQKHRLRKSIHEVDESQDLECVMVQMTKPKQALLKGRGKLTQSYYPTPNYSGALIPIQAGIQMDWYTYAETKNGFKASAWIGLNNGLPETQEEADEIVKNIKGEQTADENQAGMLFSFSDSGENAVTVTKLDGNNLAQRYIESGKYVDSRIMIAHGVVSPSLFALFTETMFGSKEEMLLAYGIFKENYVKFRQRNVAEPLTWALKLLNGFTGKIVFNDYTPDYLKTEVTTAPEVTQMSAEVDQVAEMFANCGVSRSEYKVKHSETFDEKRTDEDFIKQFSQFNDITELQNGILSMIKSGESYQAIQKAFDITAKKLSSELISLGKKGLIQNWTLTDKGEKSISVDFKVLYSYETKTNVPPAKSGSRPFCTRMLELDRLYTRQEINTISGAVDRDVWYYRGGWYHNPDTDRNTPSCRHEWKQNLVTKN